MKKSRVLIFAAVISLCFTSFTFAAENADAGALPAPIEDAVSETLSAPTEDAVSETLSAPTEDAAAETLSALAEDAATGPSIELPDSHDPADLLGMVEAAIRILAEQYNESYWDRNASQAVSLDIRSTRVICIKEELDESQEEFLLSVQEELFGDVRYIIEFLLYEDYMTGGVYSYPTSEELIIHDDGSVEWVSGYLDKYRGRTFSVDYSGFIEQVIDLHEQCNQVIRFQGEEIIFEK